MKRAQLKMIDQKNYAVMLGEKELGIAKNSFDASFWVNALNDALEAAYREGYHAATDAEGN